MSSKLTSTNPYLRDRDVRERTVTTSVETSSSIEGIRTIFKRRARPSNSRAKTVKRGPAPKLQQQIELIQQLPQAKQRFAIEMLDTALQRTAR
ncbi:MAG: hypothetical protein QOF42_2104 [Gammaproteobacteria bacterium]|jgi:hypothetical protein|nr:hypothetical protein [Gammaproteobacteria bacterium]